MEQKRKTQTKHNLFRGAALLLMLLMLSACSKPQPTDPSVDRSSAASIERSGVWSLADRYPSKYTTLTYTTFYETNGEPFCLRITRSKQKPEITKHVRDSRDANGLVYTLSESKTTTEDGKASYTYYECLTGEFRYFLGRESDGFFVESYLTMDEAIALMSDPFSPRGSVTYSDAEWNAYFYTDDCILDILIRPNDGGKLISSLSATHSAREDQGETIYVSETGDDVAYTNGTDSIRIRQADRSGADHTDHHTISECKTILALLGSN